MRMVMCWGCHFWTGFTFIASYVAALEETFDAFCAGCAGGVGFGSF